MFEKFSVQDIDSAGRGGEYTVQAGFGWTNGVALWVAAQYGHQLAAPSCPDLLASAEAADNGAGASASASMSASAACGARICASASGSVGAPGTASGTGSGSGTAASPSSTGKNAGARTAAGGALALLVGVLAAAAIAA
jgi:hypothetical protein